MRDLEIVMLNLEPADRQLEISDLLTQLLDCRMFLASVFLLQAHWRRATGQCRIYEDGKSKNEREP